ncbi:MAG: ATP-binding protein [Defluviitaleaceae bacterium]|nr:ATP-binding protein [Defluviitaleaceae bacterium]
MDLTKIKISNFKGIEYVEFDLSKSPHNNVYTLVGINESGKTTILEAINYFEYNDEKDLVGSNINFEDLIPVKEKANFNGTISIESTLSVDKNDNDTLRSFLTEKHSYTLEKDLSEIKITQKYFYKNSEYEKSDFTWDTELNVKSKKQRKYFDLYLNDRKVWYETIEFLQTKMPKILYFQTAFFDFPDKICLTSTDKDKKNIFIRELIQDILNSMENNMNVKEHIIDRAINNNEKLLRATALEMGRKITEVILQEWTKVFSNTQYNKININIYSEVVEKNKRVFLEFDFEGPDGGFKLSERSLGFRWFFVFLLVTQFRSFRKNENRHIVFLFDEPAANLSNKAQKQLLKSLENISNKCTIIYTTHSRNLINLNWLEGAHVVSNDALEKDDLETFSAKNTNIKLYKYRTYVDKYPQNVSYFQPISDLLEYIPNELDMCLPSVIVEGKNDFYTLKYFFEVQNKLDEICLMPGMTGNNVDTLISLLYAWGTDFIILLDSDGSAAKNNKERYLKLFGGMVEGKIYTLEDIDAKWKKNMESILTSSQRLQIQQSLFHSKKYSKNVYNKAIQELLMTKNKRNIDGSISDDFKKIHSFLNTKLKELKKD